MSMVINHNLSALNTYNQLNKNTKLMNNSLEKLSSGYRINNASDDAAGLAISEKMRGQIRGLDQASSNAQNGISMVQTAEGALNETTSILQRMRELAVESASDTNTDDDRTAIQDEVNDLVDEIDNISDTTEFNTKKLLDGSMGSATVSTANVDTNTSLMAAGAAAKTSSALTDLTNTAGKSLGIETGDTVTVSYMKGGQLVTGSAKVGASTTLSDIFGNLTDPDSTNSALTVTTTSDADYAASAFSDISSSLVSSETYTVSVATAASGTTGAFDLTLKDSAGNTVATATDATASSSVTLKDSNGNAIATLAAPSTMADGDSVDLTLNYASATVSAPTGTAGYTATTGTAASGTYSVSVAANGSNFDFTMKDADGNTVATATGVATGSAAALKDADGNTLVTLSNTAYGDGDAVSFSVTSPYINTSKDLALAASADGTGITTTAADKGTSNAIYGLTITVADSDGDENSAATNALSSFTETATATDVRNDGTSTVLIGANTGEDIKINIGAMDATTLGVKGLQVDSQAAANVAIKVIDTATQKVSAQRAALGAVENRLDSTINNLSTTSENLTAAESSIRDVDMASEMANYTKLSVITQAATAMLAQANQQPQQVLTLLK